MEHEGEPQEESVHAESGFTLIDAGPRRRAMDWSLALASHGIFATILRDAETGAFRLAIPSKESSDAQRIILMFVRENPHRNVRSDLEADTRFFHVGGFLFAAFWALVYGLDLAVDGNLKVHGMMNSEAVSAGEWWRLFTAIELHADIEHLSSNAVMGSVLGGLGIARFGSGTTLLCGLIAGAAGNLLGLLLYSNNHLGLGASGLVFGLLGLISVHSLTSLFDSDRSRKVFIASLASGVLLFVLTGLSPESDIIAHAGGFVAGGGIGALLSTGMSRRPDVLQSWNIPAFLASVIVILGTWWLALS